MELNDFRSKATAFFQRYKEWAPLATILLMLPHFYWMARGAFRDRLQPDAETYLAIVQGMQHPWDTVPRESLLIWIVKLFGIFLEPKLSVHLMGFAFFLGTSYLVFLIGRNIFGRIWVGILGQYFFLHNPELVRLAAYGLRDNLFNFGVAAFVYFTFLSKEKISSQHRLWGLTFAACFLVGTRITAMSPTLFLLLVSAWYFKRSYKTVLLPVLAVLPIIVPFMMTSVEKSGDPMYAANVHAVWWRNYEFVTLKKTGCEGCPTAEEVAESTYAGEPISVFKYLFGLHSLREIAEYTTRGLFKLFLYPKDIYYSLSGVSKYYHAFYLLGLIAILRMGFWQLPCIFAIFVNFLAYTLHIGMPHRLFSYVGILYSVSIALGIVFAFELLTSFKRNRYSVRATLREAF